MRRNLSRVQHLLELIEELADRRGISLDRLRDEWVSTRDSTGEPLSDDEFEYLCELVQRQGFIRNGLGREVQLTWSGHDYLDTLRAGMRP